MSKYEACELKDESVQWDILARDKARIAELSRKVGQLVMETSGSRKKKCPAARSTDATSYVVGGPSVSRSKGAPSS